MFAGLSFDLILANLNKNALLSEMQSYLDAFQSAVDEACKARRRTLAKQEDLGSEIVRRIPARRRLEIVEAEREWVHRTKGNRRGGTN